MAAPDAAVLVIGATGILRPAVQTLLERNTSVVAVARDASALAALARAPGVNRLTRPDLTVRAVDARDAAALAHALDGVGLTSAIAYDPAVSTDSRAVLARLVDGPVLRVLTSGAADPARPRRRPPQWPFVELLLGWTGDGRWHSPGEVSAAAIDALAAAAEDGEVSASVLGRVRPWSERPR